MLAHDAVLGRRGQETVACVHSHAQLQSVSPTVRREQIREDRNVSHRDRRRRQRYCAAFWRRYRVFSTVSIYSARMQAHTVTEPCVQGHNGSGSVFFSMCNLRCSFCQNHDISHQKKGFNLPPDELAQWLVKLQEVGHVHNINFITPEHVVPQVVLAIMHARDQGLTLPIIYNTSAYDSLESLRLLDGLVDIYLPDFKVWEPATSKRLLKADDYAAAARDSIKAMYDQVGDLCFTPDGIAKKGLLVRHLVMPGLEAEGARIMKFLAQEISRDCFVNIMGKNTTFQKPRLKFINGHWQNNTIPTHTSASPDGNLVALKRQKREK